MSQLATKISRLHMLFDVHLSLFKVNTGFCPNEFKTLSEIVCPYIAEHPRNTYQKSLAAARPSKRNAQERLRSCVMYFRTANGVLDEATSRNYSRNSLLDAFMFLWSGCSELMDSKTRWPETNRREITRNYIPAFPECIGFMDGTLCKYAAHRASSTKNTSTGVRKCTF